MNAAWFLVVGLLILFHSTVANGEWILESQYPPESGYPRIALVGDQAYFFSDRSSIFSSKTYDVGLMDRYWILDTDNLEWISGFSNGDLPIKRQEYCIASLENQIFMFGGYSTLNLNDFYKFDTQTKRWTILSPFNNGPSVRSGHSCFFWNGDFYVYGGYGMNDMWNYKTESNIWSQVEFKNASPRDTDGILGQISESKFYIFDKYWSRLGYSIILSSFDLVERIWKVEAEYPKSESRLYVNLEILDNKLFSFGGFLDYSESNTLKVINLKTMKMIFDQDYYPIDKPVPYLISKPSARSNAFTFAAKNKILVFGGFRDPSQDLNDVWVLDPVSLEWIDSSLSRYPIARANARTVAVSDHEFVMFGGRIYLHDLQYGQLINDLWIYDSGTKKWNRLSQETPCLQTNSSCMPLVDNPSVGAFGGNVFVIGGQVSTGTREQPIARVFNLGKKTWSALIVSQDFLNAAGKVHQAQ